MGIPCPDPVSLVLQLLLLLLLPQLLLIVLLSRFLVSLLLSATAQLSVPVTRVLPVPACVQCHYQRWTCHLFPLMFILWFLLFHDKEVKGCSRLSEQGK